VNVTRLLNEAPHSPAGERPAEGTSHSPRWRPHTNPECREWNLACLKGSAEGFVRGTVSLLRVQTWTNRALRVGASIEDVQKILERFGLHLNGALDVEALEAD
jgi:hypothetical protein